MEIKATVHKCTCRDCGTRFEIRTATGPVLTCDECYAAHLAAFWALMG